MDNHEISGVKCTVENCMYHRADDCCEAGSIEVNSKCDCNSSCDTECKTYQSK